MKADQILPLFFTLFGQSAKGALSPAEILVLNHISRQAMLTRWPARPITQWYSSTS